MILPNILPILLVLAIVTIHLITNFEREKKVSMIASYVVLISSTIIYILNETYKAFPIVLSLILMPFVLLLSILTIIIFSQKTIFIRNKFVDREFLRKIFHLLALFLLLPQSILNNLLSPLRQIFLIADVGSLISKSFETTVQFLHFSILNIATSALVVFTLLNYLRIHTKFLKYPITLIREYERDRFSGEFYLSIGVTAVLMLFRWDIARISIATSMISDAAGGVFGQKFGRREIVKNRTLEGTTAEFLSAFIILSIFINSLYAFFVAFILIIADLTVCQYVSDNLMFPLIISITLQFIW